ncbi:hypothetical protein PsorP6_004755 [Peronosclerospora sorghi]|uniref:Uncharacterized protein n=1 Tax=Peronosclerospora sorghi TaxID=230839 RepID=A0ACC0VJW2_9STRA|nr:hypothetical protein PsorP6_004755 [Peronosclerospora sorghi]
MESTDPYNVTEFSYRMDSESDKEARIWMSIQTKKHDEFVGVVTDINERGDMHPIEVASNELAKSHLRHLAGGRPENVRSTTVFILIVRRLGLYILLTVIYIFQQITNERLFRLEFPERPGALKDFLDTLRYVPFGMLHTPPRKTKAPYI